MIWTLDLCVTSAMLYQLSYEATHWDLYGFNIPTAGPDVGKNQHPKQNISDCFPANI